MSVIWKYAMDANPYMVNGGQVFRVPVGSVFRHCAAQGAAIAVWLEVPDPDAETEERWFRFFGTGYALQGDDLTYLGTAMFDDGLFVLHVYEARR